MTSIAEQVGRVVGGRYRLLAPVGTGASAQVFAASDTRLSRRVAVKVLQPMLAADEAFLRRFRAEARLAASLDHPHIMRVFDWGEDREGPYLVLEYLGGGSLRSLLDTGTRLSYSQAATVGAQAAAGLAYAHRRGIVHRDIKPGNLLFDEEGNLRIADFGVARALAESALTEPLGVMFGTARYASPEQAEARPLDDRSDVYSLALVLYETLTGRVPFSGDTIAALLMARVGASLPMPPELGPLAPILAQAAIAEPIARLDAASLQADLELLGRELPPAAPLPLAPTSPAPSTLAWLDRDPTIVDPAGRSPIPPVLAEARPERSSAAGSEPAPEGPPPLSRPPRRRRRRFFAMGAAAVILLVGAAIAASLVWVHDSASTHAVPSFTSLSFAEAERAAARADLDVRATSQVWDADAQAGTVIGQSIPSGRRERAHTVVDLTLSRGTHPVAVPSLAGDSWVTAIRALTAGHLRHRFALGRYSSAVRRGNVITWSPQGRLVPPGSVVTVTLSKGPPPRPVPAVPSTDTYPVAARLLQSQGFKAVEAKAYSLKVPAGRVILTTPGPSSGPQSFGSTVVVTVSLGPRYIAIPSDLVGETVATARQQLLTLGFNVVVESPGIVVDTVPGPGRLEVQGSTVYLFGL